MSNYILDAIFLLFAIIILVHYGKKGLFKTIMGFARLVVSALAAYYFGSKVATFLADKFFATKIYNAVYNKIEALYQSAADGFDAQSILGAFPSFLIPESMQQQITSMDETGEELVLSASDKLSTALTSIVSTVVGYVLVFIIALIVASIVIAVISSIVNKLKIIGSLDHFLGFVLGVVIVAILLVVSASVLRFFFADADFYTQSRIIKLINDSQVQEKIAFLNIDGLLSKAFNR